MKGSTLQMTKKYIPLTHDVGNGTVKKFSQYKSFKSEKSNGINIELTPTQYDYLYEVIMFAYECDVPEQKEWDLQTFDNMLHNVTNGQSTILSNNVRGIL